MHVDTKQLACGFSLPVFGAGTWMMGGGRTRDENNDDARDIEALNAALDAGLTHLDTAEMYAEGHAELLVGEVLKNRRRSDIILASKVMPANLRHDALLRSAENSLRRLGTDYLDLYFVHLPNPEIPMAETFSALQKLADQRVIRNVAVSNFSRERIEQAQQLIAHKIVGAQVHYNLIFREAAVSGVLEYCQQNDMMLIAWRPVQKGILTVGGTELFDRVCRKYGKTPAQTAINWLIAQPNVVTLSTMRSKEHLAENLGALGWCMEQADVELLTRDFPGQRFVSDAVPLS